MLYTILLQKCYMLYTQTQAGYLLGQLNQENAVFYTPCSVWLFLYSRHCPRYTFLIIAGILPSPTWSECLARLLPRTDLADPASALLDCSVRTYPVGSARVLSVRHTFLRSCPRLVILFRT